MPAELSGGANKKPKDKILPKFTLAFFERPIMTGFLWLVLVIFGIFSYTTLLRREGFPSVSIPLTIVSGIYLVNNPAKVDSDVARPISDIALSQSGVKSIQTRSADNFFIATVQYKEGTDASSAANQFQKAVETSGKIPSSARVQYSVPYFGATGGDTKQIDVAISFFDKNGKTTTAGLAAKAEEAASYLNNKKLKNIQSVFVKNPFEQITDPTSGRQVSVQHTFDRYGTRQDNNTQFYNSVIIGVAAAKGADVIKLDKEVQEALQDLQKQPEFTGYGTAISASFAPSIKDNLSELQRVLLEGLLAVLIVGSVVIAIRASLITVISMVAVLLITLAFLYVIGYTLNVITLFALILGLALIVDDTIIMVDAIDAQRQRQKNRRQIVLVATRKISRAMVAATVTAALCFAPLLFVSGILGAFIRAIPITLIAALIISLFVALIFIPFFARFLLLGKKQMQGKGAREVAAGFEAKLAHIITRPMAWTRNSRAKLVTVIITAVIIGFGFIGAGLFIARDVVFNIFPPTKDTNGVALSLQFPPNTTIGQAEAIAQDANKLAADVLGSFFVQSSYYATGDAQTAQLQIQITPYTSRNIASPELVKQLQNRFNADFKHARVAVAQLDIGPPAAAFTVQIDAANREAAYKLATDLAAYVSRAELKRANGTLARLNNINISSPNQYLRAGNKSIITVSSGFDGTDTTTLVTLAQNAIKKAFPDGKLAQYGLPRGAISFDIGQESDNQNSFKTLALAFPALLVVIFILLAIQFRSLLQPLLIFMAIPFSIFGVMLGLRITHNAISFFSMLGFFALVGLSIKNTILLTDYANQARQQGLTPIDAAAAALEERFRPLFATSLTAMVSLIPLAVSSPFWQGLAVVLIFGLLSSTFLVVTVFPYYYLGAEYLRLKVPAKTFLMWFVPTLILTIGLAKLTSTGIGLLVLPLSLYLVLVYGFIKRRISR